MKPENLLFDNIRSRNLKLVDFGLSSPLSQSSFDIFKIKVTPVSFPACPVYHLKGSCGTPCMSACFQVFFKLVYSAPEVFDALYDGIRTDLWSAGVVLYV